jgi:hypothetical protein
LRRTTIGLVLAAVLAAFTTPATMASDSVPADSSKMVSPPADSAGAQPEAILYYFHRTLRCQTCLAIEANIDDAVRTYFADELREGRLQWHPMNIELPENAHFEKDFSLEFNSAILVDLDEGEITSWSNLERVWDLLESKEDFLVYIREHVAQVLHPEADQP